MGATTKIEWTRGDDGAPGVTWNPVTGCAKVSAGCDHCYAERIAERFHGKGSLADVALHEDRLLAPLRWRKPRRCFVNSMSDLFHEAVPDGFIAQVLAVMACAPKHTFQILTKRHGRMASLLSSEEFMRSVASASIRIATDRSLMLPFPGPLWPLPNVWLGVSVEDQRWADIRIPKLLDSPAAVRFVSAEPLIGPVDLCEWPGAEPPGLDWVIVGGESGPGARLMRPGWARVAARAVPRRGRRLLREADGLSLVARARARARPRRRPSGVAGGPAGPRVPPRPPARKRGGLVAAEARRTAAPAYLSRRRRADGQARCPACGMRKPPLAFEAHRRRRRLCAAARRGGGSGAP